MYYQLCFGYFMQKNPLIKTEINILFQVYETGGMNTKGSTKNLFSLKFGL